MNHSKLRADKRARKKKPVRILAFVLAMVLAFSSLTIGAAYDDSHVFSYESNETTEEAPAHESGEEAVTGDEEIGGGEEVVGDGDAENEEVNNDENGEYPEDNEEDEEEDEEEYKLIAQLDSEALTLGYRTVTFDPNGGRTLEGQDERVLHDEQLTIGDDMPADPVRGGFVFRRWTLEYEEDSADNNAFTGDTEVEEDMTVFAQWGREVTFNGNGANDFENPGSRVIVDGRTPEWMYNEFGTTWPNNPERQGFTFAGWSFRYDQLPGAPGNYANFIQREGGIPVTSSGTLFAIWRANPIIDITFNSQGGTPNELENAFRHANRQAVGGESIIWSTSAENGNGTLFGMNFGSYFPQGVQVGGALNVHTGMYPDNTWLEPIPSAPTRPGWTFHGWRTEPTTTVLTTADASLPGYVFNGDTDITDEMHKWSDLTSNDIRPMTVHADWSHRVTFNTNGRGSVVFPGVANVDPANAIDIRQSGNSINQTFAAGGDRAFPNDPSHTNYHFMGWFSVEWSDENNMAAPPNGANFTLNLASGTLVPNNSTIAIRPFNADTAVNRNMNVFAAWRSRSVVTFEFNTSNNGQLESSETRRVLTPGTSISEGAFQGTGTTRNDNTPNPTRQGFNFDGWYSLEWVDSSRAGVPTLVNVGRDPDNHNIWNPRNTAEVNIVPFDRYTPVDGNIRVFARWVDTGSVTITFLSHGQPFTGVIGGTDASERSLTIGHNTSLASNRLQMPQLPNVRTSDNHIFVGYFTQETGGVLFLRNRPITENITVHARWIPAHTVRFVLNHDENDNTNLAGTPRRVHHSRAIVQNDASHYAHRTTSTSDSLTGTHAQTYTNHSGSVANPAQFDRANYRYTFAGWSMERDGSDNLRLTQAQVGARIITEPNTTFYAIWNRTAIPVVNRSLTFFLNPPAQPTNPNTNLGTRLVPDGRTFRDTGLDLPSAPTFRDSNGVIWIFDGWDYNASGARNPFDHDLPVTVNRNVHARWVDHVLPATITFNNNAGSVPGSGSSANVATRPVPSVVTVDAFNTVARAHLHPQFDIPPHTMPFFGTGGLPALTGAGQGYAFRGWANTASSAPEWFDANTAVTGSRTVWARWARGITFVPNGAGASLTGILADRNYIPMADVVANGNVLGNLFPEDDPVWEGHEFLGWFSTPSRDHGGFMLDDELELLSAMTFYARWTARIEFDANEGVLSRGGTTTTAYFSGENETQRALIHFSIPGASRSNHRFANWNTEPDRSGATFTSTTIVPNSMRLYAQWDSDVTFRVLEGPDACTVANPYDTVTVRSGTAIGNNMPADPAPAPGYEFVRWYTVVGNPTRVTFDDNIEVNGHVTVFAEFRSIEATITFIRNHNAADNVVHATVLIPDTAYAIGALPAGPAAPAGHTFSGWFTARTGGTMITPATMFLGDTTVYAQYTSNAGPGPGPGDSGNGDPGNGGPGNVDTGTPPPLPPVVDNNSNLVPGEGNNSWIELDEFGVPLGEWNYDEDDDVWIFDQAVPLGAMPQTGETPLSHILFLIGAMLACAGIVVQIIKRKRLNG